MQASGVKRHRQECFFCFLREREGERSAPRHRASCAALYAPIDKIKEQRDESGAKQRVRGRGVGRGEKRRGCFMSLTSYEGD